MEPTPGTQAGTPRIDRGIDLLRPHQVSQDEQEDPVSSARTGTVRITVVTSPACHFCDDAEQSLAGLAGSFAFELEHVPLETPAGARLVAEHRPALSPLVLVDGAYFSAGRLPRKKLVTLLTARGSALVPAAGSDG